MDAMRLTHLSTLTRCDRSMLACPAACSRCSRGEGESDQRHDDNAFNSTCNQPMLPSNHPEHCRQQAIKPAQQHSRFLIPARSFQLKHNPCKARVQPFCPTKKPRPKQTQPCHVPCIVLLQARHPWLDRTSEDAATALLTSPRSSSTFSTLGDTVRSSLTTPKGLRRAEGTG